MTNKIPTLKVDYKYTENWRYVALSEYGKKRNRPHYHLLFFGFPLIDFYKCQRFVSDAWQMGFVLCKRVYNDKASLYVSKYLHKTFNFAPVGCHPPFKLQSNRNGGIGRPFLDGRLEEIRNILSSGNSYFYHDILSGQTKEFVPDRYFLDKIFPTPARYYHIKMRKHLMSYFIHSFILQCHNFQKEFKTYEPCNRFFTAIFPDTTITMPRLFKQVAKKLRCSGLTDADAINFYRDQYYIDVTLLLSKTYKYSLSHFDIDESKRLYLQRQQYLYHVSLNSPPLDLAYLATKKHNFYSVNFQKSIL